MDGGTKQTKKKKKKHSMIVIIGPAQAKLTP